MVQYRLIHYAYLLSRFLDGVKIRGSDGKPNKGAVRQHERIQITFFRARKRLGMGTALCYFCFNSCFIMKKGCRSTYYFSLTSTWTANNFNFILNTLISFTYKAQAHVYLRGILTCNRS